MGLSGWGGKSSGASSPPSAVPSGSKLRSTSLPTAAAAMEESGASKTLGKKASSRWYTGSGLMDLITPSSPRPSPSTNSNEPLPASDVLVEPPPAEPEEPTALDTSLPSASVPVDATALSDAMDTPLPEPVVKAEPEIDEQALQRAWEENWRTREVWVHGEKREMRFVLVRLEILLSLPTLYVLF